MQMADVPFAQRQPGYLQAVYSPSSLRGYAPKNKGIPKWLDYWLYGPPIVRDSSPHAMAYVFGRTEHDKEWNKTPKGSVNRLFKSTFLILAYIFFFICSFGSIARTIAEYHKGVPPPAVSIKGVACNPGFLKDCQPGCVREGLFKCVPSKN